MFYDFKSLFLFLITSEEHTLRTLSASSSVSYPEVRTQSEGNLAFSIVPIVHIKGRRIQSREILTLNSSQTHFSPHFTFSLPSWKEHEHSVYPSSLPSSLFHLKALELLVNSSYSTFFITLQGTRTEFGLSDFALHSFRFIPNGCYCRRSSTAGWCPHRWWNQGRAPPFVTSNAWLSRPSWPPYYCPGHNRLRRRQKSERPGNPLHHFRFQAQYVFFLLLVRSPSFNPVF